MAQVYTNPCNGENARLTRAHCSATHSAPPCARLRCHPVWQAADVPDFFGPPIVRSLHRQGRLSLFALTIVAKNERADLSQHDRNGLRGLTKLLADTYRRTRP